MRVLLIERECDTPRSIAPMLQSAGFTVFTTDLGEDAVYLARLYDYDIVLLSPKLPDISGDEVVRRMRALHISVPVLMLAGEIGQATPVGEDDVIAMPVDKDALVARVYAVVRRCPRRPPRAISVGDLVVNLDRNTVAVGGKPVHLGAKEYQTLEYLALHKGRVLSGESICQHLYGCLDAPETRIVEVLVSRLRKKLAHASNGETYIETVWGRGYVLREPHDTDEKISA
jgi:two-component system cell cycle response regulator CtrA